MEAKLAAVATELDLRRAGEVAAQERFLEEQLGSGVET
jgi:hypothetical protein